MVLASRLESGVEDRVEDTLFTLSVKEIISSSEKARCLCVPFRYPGSDSPAIQRKN